MAIIHPFREFLYKLWLQTEVRRPERQFPLPLSSGIVDYQFHNIPGEVTRIFTVEVYTDEDTQELIASDDGNGNLVEVIPESLDVSTGANNTVDYVNNSLSITFDQFFFSKLTNPPFVKFSILLADEGDEHHAELRDFLEHIFALYKKEEFDVQRDYYKPSKIPTHLFDVFANNHGWTIDRFFDDSEQYIRLQLKHMYDLYKNKRRKAGIDFAATIINKTIKMYNLLAERGVSEAETESNYNDFQSYLRFFTDELLALGDSDPDTVQAIYDALYADSSLFYPTKHFLLDLALDIINEDGSILRDKDIATLRFYTLIVRGKTQFPHFSATLGVNTDVDYNEQDGTPFSFLLRPDEAAFYISQFETIPAGPAGVFSIASVDTGAWMILPFILNNKHKLNSGLNLNMDEDDIGKYLQTFKLGTGSWPNLTYDLTDLEEPFFESSNIEFRYEGLNLYFVCTVTYTEANDTPITEMGIFNGGGELAFYIKHPIAIKKDTHTLVYKIKINNAAPTGV